MSLTFLFLQDLEFQLQHHGQIPINKNDLMQATLDKKISHILSKKVF